MVLHYLCAFTGSRNVFSRAEEPWLRLQFREDWERYRATVNRWTPHFGWETRTMSINTLKTIIGFLATLLRKLGLIKLEGGTIAQIYNYLPISQQLSTSGQPTAAELQKIKDAGFAAIINLAPANAENSLANEAAIVSELGLTYIHIPVDFKNPTEDDFASFVDAMNGLAGRDVWVHCAANMRVSAFVYRYRREILAQSEAAARQDLSKIWEPFGVWKSFVNVGWEKKPR